MDDFDARVARSLERIRDIHLKSVGVGVAGERSRFLERLKRRRNHTYVVLAAVTVIGIVGTLIVSPRAWFTDDQPRPVAPLPSPSSAPSPSESPNSPDRGKPEEVFAMWPETSRRAALEACSRGPGAPGWRNFADRTALRFAATVLGWDRAVDLGGEPSGGGLDTLLTRSEAETETGPHVLISLRQSPESCWSVTQVRSSPDRLRFLSVSVRGSRVSAYFPQLRAADIDVSIGYGDQLEYAPAGDGVDGSVEFDLGFEPKDEGSGFLLILYRDRNGLVFSGASTLLPGGDFAAS
jgi:hypothetical protein